MMIFMKTDKQINIGIKTMQSAHDLTKLESNYRHNISLLFEIRKLNLNGFGGVDEQAKKTARFFIEKIENNDKENSEILKNIISKL